MVNAVPALGSNFESGHDDLIHDAQLDYFGKKLATCSSDKSIRIFEVDGEQHKFVTTLEGHDGPVWQASWAHPKFGTVLATASFDGKVIIWKETAGRWEQVRTHSVHSASVNSVSWAPYEYGLMLASGSSDGKVSILTCNEDKTWVSKEFSAHSIGVNAVSWCPAIPTTELTHPNTTEEASTSPVLQRRLATAGCDNLVRIWVQHADGNWAEEKVLKGHSDWVRDVAFSPNLGLPIHYMASCGQDKQVFIYTFNPKEAQIGSQAPASNSQNSRFSLGSGWTCKSLHQSGEAFPDIVWRVSWSPSGNILAVSSGDNKVTLWKENLDGEWQLIGDVLDTPATTPQALAS